MLTGSIILLVYTLYIAIWHNQYELFNSVQVLMSTVASVTGIPEDKQVLLISNGEALDPTERVCSYSSAGTVSNTWLNGTNSRIKVTGCQWVNQKNNHAFLVNCVYFDFCSYRYLISVFKTRNFVCKCLYGHSQMMLFSLP